MINFCVVTLMFFKQGKVQELITWLASGPNMHYLIDLYISKRSIPLMSSKHHRYRSIDLNIEMWGKLT